MKVIRKIWIGKTIKEDSMSWHVGQHVRLGKDPSEKGIISHIKEEGDGAVIYVKRDNKVMPWKKTSMNYTLEYDVVF